jgi:hypothetical protein
MPENTKVIGLPPMQEWSVYLEKPTAGGEHMLYGRDYVLARVPEVAREKVVHRWPGWVNDKNCRIEIVPWGQRPKTCRSHCLAGQHLADRKH